MPVDKKVVITSLRENPEDLAILHAWLDEREVEVREVGTSYATLELIIESAEVYRDAGFYEYALETFGQVLDALQMDSSLSGDEYNHLAKRARESMKERER